MVRKWRTADAVKRGGEAGGGGETSFWGRKDGASIHLVASTAATRAAARAPGLLRGSQRSRSESQPRPCQAPSGQPLGSVVAGEPQAPGMGRGGTKSNAPATPQTPKALCAAPRTSLQKLLEIALSLLSTSAGEGRRKAGYEAYRAGHGVWAAKNGGGGGRRRASGGVGW